MTEPDNRILGIAGRQHPVTKRLFELLADGEWHDYETVVREVVKVVTPGEAVREMEAQRQNAAKLGGYEYREREYTMEQLTRYADSGARRIVAHAIASLKRIEIDPPGRHPRGTKRSIRARPPNLSRADRKNPTPRSEEPPPPKRMFDVQQPRTGGAVYESGRRVDEDPQVIRKWAAENGAELPPIGRLPKWVVDMYRAYSDAGEVPEAGAQPVADAVADPPHRPEVAP